MIVRVKVERFVGSSNACGVRKTVSRRPNRADRSGSKEPLTAAKFYRGVRLVRR